MNPYDQPPRVQAHAELLAEARRDYMVAWSLMQQTFAVLEELGAKLNFATPHIAERNVADDYDDPQALTLRPTPRQHRAPRETPLSRTTAVEPLTQREQEVLRLLAAGLSNKEIGTALIVSIRTVERHTANVYRKLQIHSRAAATAYAVRYGLSHVG